MRQSQATVSRQEIASVSSPSCLCLDHPWQRFQGDKPTCFPELVVEAHDDRFPPTWQVCCSRCGTRWSVALVPYGGIYGDFDWERIAKDSP